MTHYDQAMKHWGNHRKDRFFQQCAAPVTSGGDYHVSQEKFLAFSKKSIDAIIRTIVEFPIYIHQDNIGYWHIVPANHLFGHKIASMEKLIAFKNEYIE